MWGHRGQWGRGHWEHRGWGHGDTGDEQHCRTWGQWDKGRGCGPPQRPPRSLPSQARTTSNTMGGGGVQGEVTPGSGTEGTPGGLSPCPGTAAVPAGPRSLLRTVQGTARRDGDVTPCPQGGVTVRGGWGGGRGRSPFFFLRPGRPRFSFLMRPAGSERADALWTLELSASDSSSASPASSLWGEGGSWGQGDVGDMVTRGYGDVGTGGTQRRRDVGTGGDTGMEGYGDVGTGGTWGYGDMGTGG